MTKYFTLLAQITYPGPAGPTHITRTCTIPNFDCEFSQDDPDDEDSIWEQTLIDLFFQQLKMGELKNFLDHSRTEYLEGKTWIYEEANKLKKLNQCNDLIELFRVRFKATDIVITILEHKIDTANKVSVPETEELLVESHDESSTQVLTISFRDHESPYHGNIFNEDEYHAASIAEDLQKEAIKSLTKIFETNLEGCKETRIESKQTAAVATIAGYQYPEQIAIFATVLCSDETLHITVMTYPQ